MSRARQDRQEMIRRVWLAGLGAYALAVREGGDGDLFPRLVKEGEQAEARGGSGAGEAGGAGDDSYPQGEAGGASEIAEPVALAAGGGLESQFLSVAGMLLDRLAERRGRMEEMIDAMLPASAVPSASAVLQARRNAQARERLLEEFGALTSAEVAALSGSRAKNKAALANRWKAEGRLFSVPHKGQTYFPAFQFDAAGRPREVVAAVVAALGGRTSEWELALWFTSADGWLGGRRPVDLLESEPEAVAEAARQALELAF